MGFLSGARYKDLNLFSEIDHILSSISDAVYYIQYLTIFSSWDLKKNCCILVQVKTTIYSKPAGRS